MGNSNSIPENTLNENYISSYQEPTLEEDITINNTQIIEPTTSSSSINSTEDKQSTTMVNNNNNQSQDTTEPKAVPAAKSGWVSSTGSASPWYNSLSSSTSSKHRASISGPYYRTRGMSVSRDSEADEDLTNIITKTSQQAQSTIDPSPVSPTVATPTTATLTTATPTTATPTTATPTTATPTTTTSTVVAPPPPTVVTSNQGVPTIITWAQGGSNVYVTGTFNGWKHKIKLIKSTHDFNVVLDLPPGTHRLKFIVDDEWKCSNDLETATDPDGNLVNYLQVMDDEENEEDMNDDADSISEYSNEIPPELLQLASILGPNDQQKKSVLEWEKKQPQPPSLPPHLEKVLLNSQTVSEEDNSVLHEPNHVTLNHLYACSIKDNVMALATTSRYRKKYVTTMYYRPVFPK